MRTIYLVGVVKAVVHEPGDQRCLPHALLSQEHQLELPQRISKVTGRRHYFSVDMSHSL